MMHLKPKVIPIILWICLMGHSLVGTAQKKPEVVVSTGHIGEVTCVTFDSKSGFIATGSNDRTVKLWDRALQQEFRTLNGHENEVKQLEFSLNGKYLASVDHNDILILWAHPSGKLLHKIPMPANGFKFVEGGDQLLLNSFLGGEDSGDESVVLWDIETAKVVKIFKETDDAERIFLHPDKQHFIVDGLKYNLETGAESALLDESKPMLRASLVNQETGFMVTFDLKGIHIYDLLNKKKLYTIPNRTGLEQFRHGVLSMSPDGKTIITATLNGKILLYNTKTGKLEKEINQYPAPTPTQMMEGEYSAWAQISHIAVSPDNKWLATAISFTEKKKTEAQASTYRGVKLWTLKKRQGVGDLRGYQKTINSLGATSNEKYMISSNYGKYNGARVWNLAKGELDLYIPSDGQMAISEEGNTMALKEWIMKGNQVINLELRVYELPEMELKFTSSEIVFGLAMNKDGTKLAGLTTDNSGPNKFFVIVWDLSAKKEIQRFSMTREERPYTMLFSANDEYLITDANKAINTWEIKTGKKINTIPYDQGMQQLLEIVPNSTNIIYSTHGFQSKVTEVNYLTGAQRTEFFVHNTKSKEFTFTFCADFDKEGKYLTIGTGGYGYQSKREVIVWDWATKTKLCTLTGHAGGVKQVWFGQQGKKIYSAGEDGIIKIWDMEQCKLAGSFIGMGDYDYLILTADNHYKASKGNISGIGFRYQGSLRTFGQFDVQLNRPDLVMKELGSSKLVQKMYHLAWKKRLKRLGLSEEIMAEDLHLPEIRIPDKLELPVLTKQSSLSFRLKAHDEVYPLSQINVLVNDVPVYGREGISLKGKNLQRIEKEIDVALNTGKNRITVSVSNEKGLESIRETFDIVYEKPSAKTDLYMLSIGVSEYDESERNLKYAQKDALDLAKLFKGIEGYKTTHIHTILNKEATLENILQTAKILQKTKVDDQVVIHISCHGLLDDQLNYYLATTDVDFDNPSEKGLPYEALEKVLDKVPARNRLIMIDACHSGEVDKSEVEWMTSTKSTNSNVKIAFRSGDKKLKSKTGLKNSFEYMKALFADISNNSGATIISAASGLEYALESSEWNNGVFTYAILEGIQSGEADINRDGQIQVSELKEYVTAKVTYLTDGAQVPTTRKVNQINDFILLRK